MARGGDEVHRENATLYLRFSISQKKSLWEKSQVRVNTYHERVSLTSVRLNFSK